MRRIWVVFGYMLLILVGSIVAQVVFSPRDAIFYMNSSMYGYVLYGGIGFLYLWGSLLFVRWIAASLRAEKKGLGIITLLITLGAFVICAKGLFDTINISRSITQENCLRRIAPSANLSHCDLVGVNLSGQDLSHADLEDVDFSYADLTGAKLTGANMRGSNLSNAKLSNADLSGADLSGSLVENTSFDDATMRKACLSHSWTSSNIDLSGLDLAEADLSFMSTNEIDFSQTKLTHANLQSMRVETYASFSHANLDYANLNSSYFNTANFSNASMQNTDLSDITFSDSALFDDADLEQAILFNFPILEATGLQIDLSMQQLGAVSVFMPTPFALCSLSTLPWASSFDPTNDRATRNVYYSFVDLGVWASYGYMEPWPEGWKIPESWVTQVTDARDMEVIICDDWNNVEIEHCSYTFCSYNRIRPDRIVTIKVAQTGDILDEKIYPGSDPKPCPGIISCPESGGIPDDIGERFQDYPTIMEWITTVLDR